MIDLNYTHYEMLLWSAVKYHIRNSSSIFEELYQYIRLLKYTSCSLLSIGLVAALEILVSYAAPHIFQVSHRI